MYFLHHFLHKSQCLTLILNQDICLYYRIIPNDSPWCSKQLRKEPTVLMLCLATTRLQSGIEDGLLLGITWYAL